MANPIRRFVEWIRRGYPAGVPATDHVAVLALLRRQLTEAEVVQVYEQLRDEWLVPLDTADVGVGVMRTTGDMPAPADVERVRRRLEAEGWPVQDAVIPPDGAGGIQ